MSNQPKAPTAARILICTTLVRILFQPRRLVVRTRFIAGARGFFPAEVPSASDLRGTVSARHRTTCGPTPDRSPGQAKTDAIVGYGSQPLCEDETMLAEDMARTFRNLGYEVAGMVSTGEDAVRPAEDAKPDLILMDIKRAVEIERLV